MKFYGIPGLGADKRVFDGLKLHRPIIPVEWIDPKNNESIEKYAARLSKVFQTDEPFGIIGVSFGGLIAVEINKILNPRITILISSITTRQELPLLYRWMGKTNIISLLPAKLLIPPYSFVAFMFGAKNKQLLIKILAKTDPEFVKWALPQLLKWTNTERIKNSIRIHGTHDRLLPLKNKKQIIFIQHGTHFMIVDNAPEVSEVINARSSPE